MKKKEILSKGHLNRRELMALVKKNKGKLTGHAAGCDECREALELLKKFPVAGRLPLADAPAGWVNKAVALAARRSILKELSKTMAELVFDSWKMPLPVGIRGQGALEHRRLQFKTAEMVFDISAERTKSHWNFLARTGGKFKSSPVLVADTDEYYPDEDGIYQWTKKKPPKRVIFKMSDMVIELPELDWKNPQKK